jgi:hypothetical protein
MAQRNKRAALTRAPRQKSAPVPLASAAARTKSLPVPRRLPEAETSNERICWRFKYADHDGPWCFHEVGSGELCRVLNQLTSFESMTVAEAFSGRPGKDYNVEDIPNQLARGRLAALGIADITKISRFRLSGAERLYGVRQQNVFYVVWWDPHHQIWPSSRD